MTFDEQMADAKARIESAKTIEAVKAAKSDYDKAKAAKAAQAEKESIMGQLAPNHEKAATAEPNTLGAFAVKNLNLAGLKGGRATVSTDFGFKANTDTNTTLPVTETSMQVVDVIQRPLSVRDLFGTEAISGNALQYYVLSATEGAPAKTAEGAAKPQIHVPHDAVTVSLDKVACFFKESDELTEDAPFLESAINNRGIYEHNLAVENYLITKLAAVSGIQSVAYATSMQDTIFTAMTDIQTATGYTADAIIINPADYQTLRLAKDSNGQYFGGGFFYGAYASGTGVQSQPGIWGLPTVVTSAVAKGTAYVGAFKAAGSVVTKAGSGLRVEVSNSNEDDFTHNLVTVRIEERLALATRVPAAFAKVATSAA